MDKNQTGTDHPEAGGCAKFEQMVRSHHDGHNRLHNDAEKGNEIYQTSIMSALMAGVFEGNVTFEELAKHGDFGLGTFNDLDGEMVAIDAKFFQLRSDGSAKLVALDQRTPFAAVTFFKPKITHELTGPLSFTEVQDIIQTLVKSDNLFYAMRLDGLFDTVETRTVSRQGKQSHSLLDASGEQALFHFKDIRGSLVGFRSPDYAQGLTVAGYHFHFINENRDGGGHVMSFDVNTGTLKIDHFSSIHIALQETKSFKDAKINNDDDEGIKKAEG